MAAPSVGSVGTFLSGNGTSANVAVPSGVAAGDIIVVTLYKENTNAVTAPSGFAELSNSPVSSAVSGQVHQQRVFWKRATGADSGTYAFSWSGNVFREAIAVRYTGCVATGNPFDFTTSAAGGSAGTTSPAVSGTTTGADRLLVWNTTNYQEPGWTFPGSWTKRVSGATSAFQVATLAQATAGSTGSLTATTDRSGAMTAWLGALLPVATSETDVSGTDSGTESESSTLDVDQQRADSGTLAESSAIGQATGDTGTETESSALAVAESLTDSGALSEGTATLATSTGVTDAGSVSDASAVAVAVSATDAGTVDEASSLAIGTTFTSDADTSTATEASSLAADSDTADVGAATDTSAVSAEYSAEDSGELTEAASIIAAIDVDDGLLVDEVSHVFGSRVLAAIHVDVNGPWKLAGAHVTGASIGYRVTGPVLALVTSKPHARPVFEAIGPNASHAVSGPRTHDKVTVSSPAIQPVVASGPKLARVVTGPEV